MPKYKISSKSLAVVSVLICVLVFSIQDLWVAQIVNNIDPLLFTFWIFLTVICFSIPVAIVRKESFRVSTSAINDLIGLNITTFISWVFTFLALAAGSPAVVGAGTLSAPLLLILVFFDKNKFKTSESVLLLTIIIVGLIIGSTEYNSFKTININSLIYCFAASIGVVGNSFFMKRLNKFGIKGNVVLSLRFLLLLSGLGLYFIFSKGSLSIELKPSIILVIGLLTSYFPLLILYFAHIHLSIFFINLMLALTPVSSIIILGFMNGFSSLNVMHIISIIMILGGVFFGYIMEAKREAA
ncbi:MAG: hypothetical protein ACXVCP_07895 [Bdellovibrio sp.]